METAPNLISWPVIIAAMFLAVLVLAVARGITRRRKLGTAHRDPNHRNDRPGTGQRQRVRDPLSR